MFKVMSSYVLGIPKLLHENHISILVEALVCEGLDR